MKTRNTQITERNLGRTIMLFGQAKLIETGQGKLELKGATKEEQVEVKEYVSLFMHEAVLSFSE